MTLPCVDLLFIVHIPSVPPLFSVLTCVET